MSYTARAYYHDGHEDDPVVIATADDVRALIDTMLEQPLQSSTVALYIQERPQHEIGVADHELRFGVLAERKLGSINYVNGLEAWYARGVHDGDGPVRYQYMGNEELFPADSLVELEVLFAVTTDFLATGAERRPEGADWAPWPDDPLEEDADDSF
ncbi:Imm1 family immunity protein [Kribbella catacumbae]|uniref:Imm1 family immunity protein n=1 Tax=Kribbella catacumbae TaxID=460086 RepID=UPI000377DB3E|nr:Imm1 family immunity protein [Kribbella catacumbae]